MALSWLSTRGRLGLGILAVGVVAWAMVEGWGRSVAFRYALPNGQTLTFLGLTRGTNHVQPGRRWARVLRRLPSSWMTGLGLEGVAASGMPLRTAEPQVMAWFGVRNPGAGWRVSLDLGHLALYVVDEEGFEWPVGADALRSSVAVFELGNYPRRSEWLRLQPTLVDAGGAFAGEGATSRVTKLDPIVVANPDRREGPRWRPEEFPLRWREGELEVKLQEAGLVWPTPQVPCFGVAALPVATMEAVLSLAESNAPTARWVPRSVLVTDATGNGVGFGVVSAVGALGVETLAPGTLRHRFFWWLSTTEPSWKFRYELRRAADSALAPEEAWWLRGVEVPSAEDVVWLNQRTNLNGVEVTVLAWVGEHAGLPDRAHDVMGQAILELECRRFPSDHDLGVAVRLEDGRLLSPEWVEPERSYGFALPPGVGRVDVRVSVVRRRYAEFTVRPRFGAP